MNISVGLKTDPIVSRYSFEWLFDLLAEEGVRFVQVGSFYELYWLEDSFFTDLRSKAETRGLRIKSVFTAHRELGGFFLGDERMIRAARRGFERLIEVGALLGADYVGSNPGSVHRDHAAAKAVGIACYLSHLKELSRQARTLGMRGLTIEPMSSLAEPPSTPAEIEHMCQEMAEYHRLRPDETVPTYLCSDIGHGLCGPDRSVIHSNTELFAASIPWTCEFHFKNTDPTFGSTFGFAESSPQGIVDLAQFSNWCASYATLWPVKEVVGYLEIPGPKLGRDYSDHLLAAELRSSLRALKAVFP
jgi:sugar phosphate isomerase/epimerase